MVETFPLDTDFLTSLLCCDIGTVYCSGTIGGPGGGLFAVTTDLALFVSRDLRQLV